MKIKIVATRRPKSDSDPVCPWLVDCPPMAKA